LSCEAEGRRIPVFSCETPTRNPETDLIPAVVADTGDPVHSSRSSPDEIERNLLSVLFHQDEPFADGSMISHYLLMRDIRNAGVKVVLSGQGADELFCGYSLHRDAALADLLRAGRLLAAARILDLRSPPNPVRLALHLAIRPSLEASLRARAPAAPLAKALRAALRESVRATPHVGGLGEAIRDCVERSTVPGFLHYEDRNSMAHGVEVRVPYLDQEVLCASLKVAPTLRFDGALGKAVLRAAVSPPVPPRVAFRRGKYGFPSALDAWLALKAPSISAWVRRWAPATEWFAAPALEALLHNYVAAPQGRHALLVWRVLIATAWHRMFIEGTLRPDSDLTAELVRA
jgi:asparagine synthase (glutamine-hydrolysing)